MVVAVCTATTTRSTGTKTPASHPSANPGVIIGAQGFNWGRHMHLISKRKRPGGSMPWPVETT